MADESIIDLVRRVRGSLQERGPLGAFLLTELEAAIASGIEVDDSSSKMKGNDSAETPGRRAPTEAELLDILAGVFETYLVTLPSIANALRKQLNEKFRIEDCEIELDRSLLRAESQTTGRTHLDEVIPMTEKNASEAILEIRRIARERR